MKELYLDEVERRMSELDEDYETASERAYLSYWERIVDKADNERKRLREEGVQ